MALSPDILRRFPNPTFIETGAYKGDGIEAALEAGFKQIESIEISPTIAKPLIQRFQNDPVTVHIGDSSELLAEVLKRYTKPCTIWLDAHGKWEEDAELIFPLRSELEAITSPHHTILIDDLRLMRSELPITVPEVVTLVKRINPDYVFSFADGHVPNDILVCQPCSIHS
jgi:hypothetical protein